MAIVFIILQFNSFQFVTDVSSVLRYTGEWGVVDSCMEIENTYCELSTLIEDFSSGYKVRVQLVAGANVSEWKSKRFYPNQSKHRAVSLVSCQGCIVIWLYNNFDSVGFFRCSYRWIDTSLFHHVGYIQLSNGSCSRKTYSEKTLSFWTHLHHLPGGERTRQKGGHTE